MLELLGAGTVTLVKEALDYTLASCTGHEETRFYFQALGSNITFGDETLVMRISL